MSDDKKAIAIAKQTMVGDLRDLVLTILRDKKYTGKAWPDMAESEQREVVGMIVNRIEHSVRTAVEIIASDGQKYIKAILNQVVVKDGIKCVFECSKHHELRHDLADAQGGAIIVILKNEDEYLGEGAPAEIDEDQPELPINDDEGEEDEDEESELEAEAADLT